MNRIIPPLTEEQRAALIAAARSFLGAPFRHQGRRPKAMDCIGLLGLSFTAIGFPITPRTDYGRLPAHKKLQKELAAHLGEPVAGPPLPGDVVSMKWSGDENHVAIVTPHPERAFGLIHSYADAQRVIEHGADALWTDRITGIYRA